MAELFPKTSEMRIKGSEQLQVILGWEEVYRQMGVGQGACLDTHLEHMLPFIGGPWGSLPAPTPEAPTRRVWGGPRPAGLLRPGSTAPGPPLCPPSTSFLPGLSSHTPCTPRTAARRTPRAAASAAS